MKFSYTHHMPYTGVKEPGQDWPVPNKQFDAVRGAEMFNHYIEDKIYAEQAGFDWIGSNEHHFSPYGMMPNPNLVGAVVAHRTSRAGILQSGNIVPITNPIRIAEEYAMIDVISGGRLVAGFMRGIPHEYVAYNISPDESYGRMYEAIELIKKAWSSPEPFGWEGQYYKFRAVSIWPRPVQQPYPRMMMSASSDASARLAAEVGSSAGFLRIADFDSARRQIKVYMDRARECGWEPTADDVMIGMNCCIAPTYEEAKAILENGQKYFFGVLGGGIRTAQRLVIQKTRYFHDEGAADKFLAKSKVQKEVSFDERVERGLIVCGTPEMAIEQIKRIHAELGNGRMNLSIKIGDIADAHVTRTLDYLRDIVFPAVRHLGEDTDPVQAAE
jgi:alkanesulfonate monooxygenase SsuD/methylene tetrahydromethanopterin reductase-like flavin-dependent oxidoreductase (luciferase family)